MSEFFKTLLAFSLALALLGLAGCEKLPSLPLPGALEKPSLVFDGFTATGTRLGEKLWEARAATAQVFNDKKLARVQNVSIRYFKNGKVVSRARADEADLNTQTEDIAAQGNVVLQAQNGAVLYTSRLRWDQKHQRVSTEDWVKVVKEDSILTGKGLIADRDLEDVVVKENVQIFARNLGAVKQLGTELQPAPRGGPGDLPDLPEPPLPAGSDGAPGSQP